MLSSKQEEEATQESLLGVSQKAVSLQIDLNNTNLITANLTREGVVFSPANVQKIIQSHRKYRQNPAPEGTLFKLYHNFLKCENLRTLELYE